MQIQKLDLPRCKVGEGPVWDVAEQALYYIDIVDRKVFRWDPATGEHTTWEVPDMIGSMALRGRGTKPDGAIVALVTGIHYLDFTSGEISPFALMDPPNPALQLADGKVDRRGRFVFGTSHRTMKEPLGGLWSLGTDGKLTQIDDDIHLGNGPCWSPDDRIFYHSDSLRHMIYAYDYDIETGMVSGRREFFDTSAYGPIPDGATVDTDGNIWVAICEGGVVLCLSPEGQVLREVKFPTNIPASCMFMGPGLGRMFVPTIDPSCVGKPSEPDDGLIFLIEGLGATGIPEPRYGG